MAVRRPVRLPAPDFANRLVPVRLERARMFWRLHPARQEAIHASLDPGHRFSHPACPFPVLHLAATPATCLWERFGDDVLQTGSRVSCALWSGRALSPVRAPRLRLCDFTSTATRSRAGVDLAALHAHDLAIPQAWGRALQDHPAAFDGVRYPSRFDGKPCVAVFARPGLLARFASGAPIPLTESPDADAFLDHNAIALV